MRGFILALSFVAFTFVSCSSEALSTVVAPRVDTLSAEQLKALVDEPDGVVFVDVRTAGELQRDGMIAGSIHIPINEFEGRLSEIPKDKKIVVACARGIRAGRGAAILLKHGYQDVFSTGLNEYKAKGYPLVLPGAGD